MYLMLKAFGAMKVLHIYELNNAYFRGEYSATEYADKLDSLKEAQWDEINTSESAIDAIMK